MRTRYSRTRGYVVDRRPKARPTVRTVQRKITFGPAAARYLGLGVLVVLGIIMFSRAGDNSTSAYTTSQLNKDIGQANQDIDELKLAAKRAESLQAIQNTAAKDAMVPVSSAQFISQGNVDTGEVAGVATQR